MARIDRKTQKVFASNASNNGQFGSAQVGTKVLSNDPDTIQALAAWLNGWNDATISGQRLPTLEEIQGIQYVVTRQLGYVFQEGIPEWDAGTTYYQNSIVRETGTYKLYGSITDDNTGNALSDGAEWQLLVDLSDVGDFTVWGGSAAGTANAIELTPASALAGYTAGSFYYFLATAANTSGTVTVDISALGTKAIKKASATGKSALAVGDIQSGQIIGLVYDGTDFQLVNPRTYSKSADIATAATLNLDAATGDYVVLTGTTTVTAITLAEGVERTCRAQGAFILTNGASLILPTGANITTEAGDVFTVRGEASGVVRVISYARASGRAIAQKLVARLYAEETNTVSLPTSSDIPKDDTVPLITEGVQVLSLSHTAKSLSNKVRVAYSLPLSASGAANVGVAVFADTTCIDARYDDVRQNLTGSVISGFVDIDVPSISPITYSVRIGLSASNGLLNGRGAVRVFGGASRATLSITEFTP